MCVKGHYLKVLLGQTVGKLRKRLGDRNVTRTKDEFVNVGSSWENLVVRMREILKGGRRIRGKFRRDCVSRHNL